MQKLIIIGNLTDNPVHKATPNGKELASFTVAVNEKHGDNDIATFYNCAAWEGRSIPILKYLHKGDKVCVEGKVKARAYIAKDGEAKAMLDVTVETCEFVLLKKQEDKKDDFTKVEAPDLPF